MHALHKKAPLNYAQNWNNQSLVDYILDALRERAQLIYAQMGTNQSRVTLDFNGKLNTLT